jgi:actin-like ATPase involved in cell morphogenesis
MVGESVDGYALGVDLGTSNTVAVLRWPDGRTRPLLFDGVPLLPSAVFLDPGGQLHVGRDAQRMAPGDPTRFEANPKRRIDDGTALLGVTEVAVVDLLAAVLTTVGRSAVEAAGFLPPAALTYPAAWGEARRDLLAEAARRAGWPPIHLIPEPVAAARHFTEVLRRPIPVGSSVAVFDFGAGTLDIAVVRRETSSFAVLATGGLTDLGGLDMDAALVEHLGVAVAGSSEPAWTRLEKPGTTAEKRDRNRFWEDVRGAKEMLSRSTAAPIPVPGLDQAIELTREELNRVADPLLRRAVAETARVIAAAGLAPHQLAGLFLVGGSSRIPLVARLLHAELGISPTVLEQPELPVAEGAVAELVALTQPTTGPSGVRSPADPWARPPVVSEAAPAPAPNGWAGPTMPISGTPPQVSPPGYPASPPLLPGTVPDNGRTSRKGRLAIVLAAVLVLLVAGGVTAYLLWPKADEVSFRPIGQAATVDTEDENARYGGLTVAGEERAFYTWKSDAKVKIVGADLTSGARIGPKTLGDADIIERIALTDDAVLVQARRYSDNERTLYALDPESLDNRWNRKLGQNEGFVAYPQTAVLYDTDSGRVRVIGAGDNRERKSLTYEDASFAVERRAKDLQRPAGLTGDPLFLTAENRFMVYRQDAIKAIDPHTGDEVGSVPASLRSGSESLAYDGRVYVVASDFSLGLKVEAYPLDGGGQARTVYLDPDTKLHPIGLSPCGDGVCLTTYRSDDSDKMVVTALPVDESGKPRWTRDLPRAEGLTPAGDGLLVTDGDDGHLWLLNQAGEVAYEHKDRRAVRIAAGSVLVLSGYSTSTTADLTLTGLTVRTTELTQLGPTDAVDATGCSWSETTLVCPSEQNLAWWRFAD